MSYRIKGETGEWEVVVGLEVHAQITATKSKFFSGAATAFGAEPNTQVSLVDAAMPGMLPVPNRECIRQAVRTGMALDAKINRWSRFDRKNYFYADLPQGYQISQLYHPLVGEGEVEILLDEKDENSAKHDRDRADPRRAGRGQADARPASDDELRRPQPLGVALMEIVSRPDMRSPAEAGAYLRKLRSILRYVGSCDGNMEEGSMRADVNVSVRKPGGELGTRTETKNVNSVRFVMAVVEHEAKRQVELLEGGGAIAQETRLYDPDKGVTRSLRSKEDAHDYRYFPDPDLLPLELDEAFLDECKASLPELPDAKRKRYEGARHHALQCQRADRRGRDRALVRRAARGGRRAQAGGELGRRRTVRRAQPARRDASSESPVTPAAGGRAARPGRRRHDQRHHRQAGVRDHARDRRGRRRDRRGARAQADQRHRRDRRRDRQGPRRQRRQGRPV